MGAVLASQPPEQGQMVSVRSRNWMVTDVSPSTLPPAACKPVWSRRSTCSRCRRSKTTASAKN